MSFFSDRVISSTQQSCAEPIFCPWTLQKDDCLEQVGYWITFFVLGILTAFIPHLVYYLAQCCKSEESVSDHSVKKPTSQPSKNSKPRTPKPSPPKPSTPKGEEKKDPKSKSLPSTPRKSLSYDVEKPLYINTNLSSRELFPPSVDSDDELDDELGATSFYAGIPPDTKRSALEEMRRDQKPLHPGHSEIPSLVSQALRAAAKQSAQVPATDMPFSTTVPFFNGCSIFRLDKTLKQENVIEALRMWPNQARHDACLLPLYGCTHMTLTEAVLTHQKFIKINVNGCKLQDVPRFIESLSRQKNLDELFLGFEQPLFLSIFHLLMKGCSELKYLNVAVDLKNEPLFFEESKLENLTLSLPRISQGALQDIFKKCPHLRGITLIVHEQIDFDLKMFLIKEKPENLEHLNLVFDCPKSQAAVSDHERVNGVETCLIHIDSDSLFSSKTAADSCNFGDIAFGMCVRLFSYDVEKLHILLRQAAQCGTTSLIELEMFGTSLAKETGLSDLNALLKIFELFPLEIDEAKYASYNVNLELILRAALKYCCKQTTAETDDFAKKRDAICKILSKNKEKFEQSSILSKN